MWWACVSSRHNKHFSQAGSLNMSIHACPSKGHGVACTVNRIDSPGTWGQHSVITAGQRDTGGARTGGEGEEEGGGAKQRHLRAGKCNTSSKTLWRVAVWDFCGDGGWLCSIPEDCDGNLLERQSYWSLSNWGQHLSALVDLLLQIDASAVRAVPLAVPSVTQIVAPLHK